MKSTVILGVVAAVLLGFILIFERGTISTGEIERRGGAVLSRFVRKRVAKIEIQRGGAMTVLERGPDEENDFELGIWKIVEPIQADADEEAVDVLLGELEWMGNRRRLDDVSSSDRARFGLDAPRYRVWYTVGSERMLMRVGNETPSGDGVYVEGDQEGSVFVVGKDLPEALDHEPGHYHTKVLHDGVSLHSTLRMTLRTEGGELQVAKRDGRFRLVAPVEGLVSRDALTKSLDALDNVKATRFIAAAVDEATRYGFDAPVLEALVVKRSLVGEAKGADSKFEEVTQRFRLGAACGQYEGESYFVVGDDGPVMCVMDAELGAMRIGLAAMREQRLLNLDDDQVGSVAITAGTWKLTLTQDSDAESWRYSVADTGADARQGDAEPASVKEWLAQLRAQTAEAFEQGAAEGPIAAASIRVHFDRIGDNPDYDIAVVRGAEPSALVRRADEPSLVRFGPAATALLRPPAARFFKRQLVSEKPGALTSIQIQRRDGRERVTKAEDGQFRIEEPQAMPADRVTIQEVARLVAELQAMRFVADRAAPEHGLATPALTATASFEGGGSVKLRFGAEVDTGRYAVLSDAPEVFVASPTLVRHLSHPLASRTAIATGLDILQSVRVQLAGGGPACEARRSGDGFASATPESLDDDGARSLARALSALRASATTAYGAGDGGDTPRATLAVTTTDGGSHTLTLGATTEGDERPSAPIRRSDVSVGYRIGAEDAERLTPCK